MTQPNSEEFLKQHGGGCQPADLDRPDIPVFTCHVLLSGPDEEGRYAARAANLQGVVGGGHSERQALLSIATAFKAVLADFRRNGEPIPWQNPPATPTAEEQERWIPVHL